MSARGGSALGGKKVIYLIVFLVIAHVVGMEGPYYNTWYYDDFLHFMGGLTLAVAAFEFFPKIKLKTGLVNILIFIIIIAILWELHEYIWDRVLVADYGFPVMQLGITDTISDFLFALLGGSVYFFIFSGKTKRYKLQSGAKNKGFTMVEILVVVAILGIIISMVGVNLFGARTGARDTKRISDLNQIGRFLSFGCPMPSSGAGEYDLNVLLQEYRTNYPQYANNIPASISDPKTGTSVLSNYKYIVDSNDDCVLYANLENGEAKVDLPAISDPTPGGGRGVLESAAAGVNGSYKYYQISN